METKMQFKIFYGDGTTYEGDPFLAPASGVIAVVMEDSEGYSVRANRDFYCWRPDVGFFCCDVGGMWDYILTHEGPKAILVGRYIRNESYYEVMSAATKAAGEGLE